MNYNHSYSTFTAWLGFILGLYGSYFLYVQETYYWIPVAFSLLLTSIRLLFGKPYLHSIFYTTSQSYLLNRIGYLSLGLGYFISSLYGLIKFIDIINLTDKSIFLIPCIAIAFLLAGTALGLFSSNNKEI